LPVLLAVCALWVCSPVMAQTGGQARSILVLEQSDVRGPFYATIFDAMRSTVNATAPATTLYVENLDLSRFGGNVYEQAVETFLNAKYRGKPIGVVVAIGSAALEFGLRWRDTLWPGTPIVFAFVDETKAASLDLPRNVTGRTTRLRLQDMVSAARAIVPGLKQVVVLGDRLDTQTVFAGFASELPSIAAEIGVLDLSGIPITDLRKRVAALPADSAILYTAIYSDGRGTYFPPSIALQMIAEVANRPIIAPVETYIGRGATGGYVVLPAVIGQEAAQQALRILSGEDAAAIPIQLGDSLKPVFDWQALEKWDVDQSLLPPGSEIRNHVLPIWEQYPRQTAAAGLIVVVQTGLIATLLSEHRRRRRAEVEGLSRANELAHLNRQATAGELSAAIAHEVNQPLGAILSNTETAELLLQSPNPDLSEIREILADIKRDNQRASDVVARTRRLLKKAPGTVVDVDLNEVVRQAFEFVAGQAAAGKIRLETRLAPTPMIVRGDPIQLQQVVLILVINSMDALREKTEGQRSIVGRVRQLDSVGCEVSVADTGPGIPPGSLKDVFDPFFTTKSHGMGMGLSIARSIVEMHGGKMAVANPSAGGAVFSFGLPPASLQ
jgi:signal transduction histidine kinase